MKKQRLELTWIGKENRPRLEPRILLEDPEKSYHAAKRVGDNDLFDNRLIVHVGAERTITELAEADVPALLRSRFGIEPPAGVSSPTARP